MDQLNDFRRIKSSKTEFLSKYFDYVEVIRHHSNIDKTNLKKTIGVAWPTLEKALAELNNDSSPISINDGKFIIQSNYAMQAGISVGATQIKVFLCDFLYRPLKYDFFVENNLCNVFDSLMEGDVRTATDPHDFEGFFCYKKEDSLDMIVSRLNCILDLLIKLDTVVFPLLSIGISFPGIINPDTLVVDFSPNIKCLTNVSLKNLISNNVWERLDENGIKVFFEHDTQAAMIYEKESLYINNLEAADAKNICCIYIAAGIGASVIMNGQLCRGSTNSFGELGHTPAPELLVSKIEDDKLSKEELNDKNATLDEGGQLNKCECGKNACLESAFRRNVFGAHNIEDFLVKIDGDGLRNFASIHPYRYRILKEYIGHMMGLIINFFNPNLIIFSGRIVWEINQLQYDLDVMKTVNSIGIPARNCDVILGTEKKYTAAAGAAISSYHCCVKNKDFCNIAWI